MDSFLNIERQEIIERQYNRKHIDGYIREEILANPEMVEKIAQGVEIVRAFTAKTYGYDSKNKRMAELAQLDPERLVLDIYVAVAYCLEDTLFTNITGELASRLGMDETYSAIVTMGELLAVLCETDAFDLNKPSLYASLRVVSRIPLSETLVNFIIQSAYLPPMICAPKELHGNRDSGYLTHDDSLILGSGNHHEGDICLDVLNTVNQVPLKLDVDFLCRVEEDPTQEFTIERVMESANKAGKPISMEKAQIRLQQQIDNWHKFKAQSYDFYELMVKSGNEFYLTNKVDKRGRLYAQGYHISTQSTQFKKAMLELAREECVEVPEEYRV